MSDLVKDLVALLNECRQQLPIAAASWNEDQNRDVADFHVPRVLDLIKRVDAALYSACPLERVARLSDEIGEQL